MNKLNILWSDHTPSNDYCSYDHVIGETPLGDFLITWKSWKESPHFSVDEKPWVKGIELFGGYSLEEAKEECEEALTIILKACWVDGAPLPPPIQTPKPTRVPRNW